MNTIIDTKQCTKCGEVKSVEEFNKRSANKDGLRSQCKECAKAHYQANREEKLEYQKAYDQEYREEKLEYNRKRHAADPVVRWVQNTRRNLNHILKGTRNHAPTLELLGCTGEEWRTHLESTFKPGMTWENRGRGEGKWEIDHITPVSSFDQEDHLQQLICWNYRNTQALWTYENAAKGNKISTEGGAA